MNKYNEVHRSMRHIFTNNLIGGIAWGLGASVGLALFFSVAGFIASQADIVPFVGSFVGDVFQFVAEKNPNLIKK